MIIWSIAVILLLAGVLTFILEVVIPPIKTYLKKPKKLTEAQIAQLNDLRNEATAVLEEKMQNEIKEQKLQALQKKKEEAEERARQREEEFERSLRESNIIKPNKNHQKFNQLSNRKKANRIKEIEETEEAKINRIIKLLGEEPTTEDVNAKKAVVVILRLPNGEKVTRRFYVAEKIQQLFWYAQIKYPYLLKNTFELSSDYPRIVYNDLEQPIESMNILKSIVLYVNFVE